MEFVNWRPRFMDTETDFVEAENVPDLIKRLNLTPGKVVEDENDIWAYRLGMTGIMVGRMLKTIYRARGKWRRPEKIGKNVGHRRFMEIFNNKRAVKQQKLPPFLTPDPE